MSSVSEGLRTFMRTYPQGVTIVTTKAGDRPYGMTVSSFTSVSLDPPLVLISIGRASHMVYPIQRAEGFAVNSLAEDQAHVADEFAKRREDPWAVFEKFSFRHGELGYPILTDATGFLECRLYRTYEAGDHLLYLGLVAAVGVFDGRGPLVYRNRRYTGLRS